MRRFLFLIFICSNVLAAPVSVNVTSNKGNPVFRAVVYLEPEEPIDFPMPDSIPKMDQVDSQFMPHILVVQKGSQVEFPNSDSIKHHVYSFSPAKQFELKLYRGAKAKPVAFPDAGEVELGCNVHDWMLGFILVVDTPYFAQTNMEGEVDFDVPEGKYKVNVWHPRIQDDESNLKRTIKVASQSNISFSLKKDLLQDLSGFEEQTDNFSEYE